MKDYIFFTHTSPDVQPSQYHFDHLCFRSLLSSNKEPSSYAQACQNSYWVQVMKAELDALEANHTWKLASLPPGKKVIGCRWVYKLKLKPDGSIDHYKA